VDTEALKAVVDLVDKVTTIGILLAAWLWERRERTAITTAYLNDMRRLLKVPPAADSDISDIGGPGI
jgi:hypothetical protein